MTVGLLTTIKSQHDLSDSWRIGIDNNSKTNLITAGIYKFSRNPIFLSMRLSVFGAFLLVPNGVMLLFLGLSEVFIQVQVRLEETHLKLVHGKDYEIYANKVRRWI
jgi:protein-S-isoprenylcysteine O-methyltransferase Ste14